MPRYTAVLLVIIFLSFTEADIYADWQYTKWGMTPDQAIEASGGKLVKYEERTAPTDKNRALLKGKHLSGQFQFDAVLYFSINTNQLSYVSLQLLDSSLRFALRQDLIQKYGKPIMESGGTARLTRWHDTAANNMVELLQIGDDFNLLRYHPLLSADNRGL